MDGYAQFLKINDADIFIIWLFLIKSSISLHLSQSIHSSTG